MPIAPRGNSYQATVNHQGQRHRKMFRTRAEAEAWELTTKAALMKGEPVQETSDGDDKPLTLETLLDLTYKRFWRGLSSETTALRNARKCIDALGPRLAPSAVTSQRIDDMIFAFEAEGISDSTINRRLAALSKMLTFALDRGYIARKPKIERKKEPQHRIRYITEEEERELLTYLDHIGQPQMRDLCILGIDTGLRVGELLRIERRDVQDGVLSVWRTKNGKARSVPLTTRCRAILEGDFEGKLFDGFSHSKVNHYWNLCRRHLGMRGDTQFVPHAMRHTFCSRLVQRGVDIVSVSKLAGHSSIVVTMRYAHLAPDSLTNAIQKLEITQQT